MIKKTFPFYEQLDSKDCGPTCLRMIAKFYGRTFSQDLLREHAFITREGVSLGGLAKAAETIGFQSLAVSVPLEVILHQVPLPCVAYWRQRHYVVVYQTDKKWVYVADPAHGLIRYGHEEFKAGWLSSKKTSSETEGIVLVLEPSPEFYELEEEGRSGYKPNPSFWLRYFKPYSGLILQLLIGLALGSTIQLAFPFINQSLIDYGIRIGSKNFIYLIVLAQLTLFAAQTLIQIFRDWILIHITSRVNIRMLTDYLRKLMRLSVGFFDTKNLGDFLQRIQQDHARIQIFLSITTLRALFSFLEIIIYGSILALYDFTIFTIFAAGAILYISWTFLFLKQRRIIDFKSFNEGAEQQSGLVQLISGMQEIKLNGSEKRRRWEWEAVQIRLFRINLKSLSLNQAQILGGVFINQTANILITFIAAVAVIEGDITLGMMLSIQFMLGQLNVPLNDLIHFIQNGQDALLSLERISEVHNMTDEDERGLLNEIGGNHSVSFENVSFRYGGVTSPLILNDVTFLIPHGKVTAIVGNSGSGKTTLLKLLMKFYEPISGKICVGNRNLQEIDSSFWRSRSGCVMQDGYLFADSIARNISESASNGLIDKERLMDATRLANLETFVDSLPLGFNTRVGSSGSSISGGQRQRILIARAIYKNPDFLLFDEATSALDANNELEIQRKLNNFFEGRTVIIVAHRLSTVRHADNIIVLEGGKVIEQGNHHTLIHNRGAYYTLVHNQLELGN